MRQMIQAVRHNLRNLANFRGREARTSFWLYAAAVYVLIQSIMALTMISLMGAMFSGDVRPGADFMRSLTPLMWAGTSIVILQAALMAAAAVRRLHDRGLTGWLALLPAPFLVWILSQQQAWMNEIFAREPRFDFDLWKSVMLANLAFYAALAVLVVLLALRGQETENRHGPPLEVEQAD